MSVWDIDLTGVDDGSTAMPEDEKFNFQLIGKARENPWKKGRVDFSAKIIDGAFAGRTIYGSFPNPDEEKTAWAAGAFVRMVKNIGIPLEPGEGPIEYLTRAAGGKFRAGITNRKVEKDGVEEMKPEIKIGSTAKATAA